MKIEVYMSKTKTNFGGKIDDKSFDYEVNEFLSLILGFSKLIEKVQGLDYSLEPFIDGANELVIDILEDNTIYSGKINGKDFSFTIEEFINLCGAFQKAASNIDGKELSDDEVISTKNMLDNMEKKS